MKLKTLWNRAQNVLAVHQFHDKIDPMLESLERIAERLRQPPPISVEVEKIKEQLAENKSVSVELEKLQPSYETLKQRGEEMIARSEGADRDVSAKGTHASCPTRPLCLDCRLQILSLRCLIKSTAEGLSQ